MKSYRVLSNLRNSGELYTPGDIITDINKADRLIANGVIELIDNSGSDSDTLPANDDAEKPAKRKPGRPRKGS